jgi:hypothetical protein
MNTLRFALKADAAVTGANAVAYLAGAPILSDWLGIPTGVLLAVGAFLAVYAALVYRLATRPAMPNAAVAAVVIANALWAVDSLLALGVDWFSPTLAGQIAIAVQAVGVAAFALLQASAMASAFSSARTGSASTSKRTA